MTNSPLASYRSKVNRLLSENSHALKCYKEEKEALATAKVDVIHAEEAQNHLQTVAQGVQQHTHDNISQIISKCLDTVYGRGEYQFRIDFQKKRGRTEAKLVLTTKEGIDLNPLHGSGGGILDIATLALRLASIMLARPKLRKLLILDEPFSHVNGEEYRERTAELLKSLTKDWGIQIVLVNGMAWLNDVGKVINLEDGK